jgi:pimeloyl-ACP methyl ester carboxylesterase
MMSIAKVNGININYQIEGQGEPLVLLAGLAMEQNGWQYQVSFFKKQYQTITLDNRGVGKSENPGGACSPKIMAEDTIRLMDYLNIKKAHILGVSMGGLIAQEIAAGYPERIMKLILSSTWAYQDNGANGITLGILEAAKLPIRQGAVRLVDASMDKLFDRWFLLPILKIQCRFMKEPVAAGFMAQRDGVMEYNSLNRLSLIKAPTLLITGTKDRVIKSTSSDTIARNIPHARLVKIDKGSHSVFTERSKTFNKEVLNFLKTG